MRVRDTMRAHIEICKRIVFRVIERKDRQNDYVIIIQFFTIAIVNSSPALVQVVGLIF